MASSTSTFVRVAPHHHQLLELDGVVHCGEDRRATAIDFVQVIKESNQDYLRVTYNLSLTRHQEVWDEVELMLSQLMKLKVKILFSVFLDFGRICLKLIRFKSRGSQPCYRFNGNF